MRMATKLYISASHLIFLGGLGVITPTMANAQGTGAANAEAAPQAIGDGDIVVTAQRRSQRLQDVPVAVSVVGGESLQRDNLKSLPDLAARLPSVKITQGALTDYLNIRGVGSGNNAGFEQSVGTFVDGVYRARARAIRAALFDVQQVEVLKGPQSIFFGANTVAGALNITSRKPGDSFAYNATALYGSDNEYLAEAGMDVPVSESLSARFVGRANGMDGFVKIRDEEDGPHIRNYQGRMSLQYDPGSNWTSSLRIDAGRTRTDNAAPFEAIGCPPGAPFPLAPTSVCGRALAYNTGAPVEDRLDLRSDSGQSWSRYRFFETAWINSLDLGPVSISATTAYFRHRSDDRINQAPLSIHSPIVDGYDAFPLESYEKYRQFSQELRIQSDVGGTFEYMIGGYYSRSNLTYLRTAAFNFTTFGAIPAVAATGTTATTPVSANTDLFQKDRTLSGFASLTIRPISQLRINLGARYTSVRKSAHRSNVFGTSENGVRSTFQPLPLSTQTVLAGVVGADLFDFPEPRRSDDRFMPSVGIQYDLGRNLMAYATYSTGFKAGGYNSNSFALSFGPEKVKAYEIGIKGQFLDRRLTLAADIFRSDYTDLQETSLIFLPSGLTASLVANAASSRSQGIEGNLSFALTPQVRLFSDLTYLDAYYVDYPNGACTQAGAATGCLIQDLSGKARPFAPKFSGNIGVDFTIEDGDNVFSASPVAYFSSRYFQSATADPTLEQRGYTKVDLRLGYGPQDKRWELAFLAKNILDTITASYRQPITGSPGSTFALAERGRALAIQFTIKN